MFSSPSPSVHTNLPAKIVPLVSILGATFETGNHGVSALASGTIAAIRHRLEGARIMILDYGRESTSWYENCGGQVVPVELINLRFSKYIFLPNNIARLLALAALIRLVPVKSWRRQLVHRSEWLRRVAAPDLNLSLNGGDSFSDIYGLARMAYVVLPQLLVLLLERPLIQLPQTYGPFKSGPARAVAGHLLTHSTLVYSRDNEGLNVIKQLLGRRSREARFAYDMGFALEPVAPKGDVVEKLRVLKSSGPLVGFNPSGLLAAGGYTGKNMFGLKAEYWALVEVVFNRLLKDPKNQILLVPHVFGPETNRESDVSACKYILEHFGPRFPQRLHYFSEYFDHHETKYVIGQCDFFLGSRMHACIGALSQCVPAVGLAYSRKFAGVMELLGEGTAVIDLRSANLQEIGDLVDDAWSRRDRMRVSLSSQMPTLRASVLDLCSDSKIQALLNQSRPQ